MTIIALDSKSIAADRLMTNGYNGDIVTENYRKITPLKMPKKEAHKSWPGPTEVLAAGAGTVSEIQKFINWWSGGADPDLWDINEEEDGAFLVASTQGYYTWNSQSPTPLHFTFEQVPFQVIGSFNEVGNYLFRKGFTARQVVEEAVQNNIHCAGEIDEWDLATRKQIEPLTTTELTQRVINWQEHQEAVANLAQSTNQITGERVGKWER